MGATKKWLSERETCDICKASIADTPFIDGKTRSGPWALMCAACFEKHGVGLGTGRGQFYAEDGVYFAHVCTICKAETDELVPALGRFQGRRFSHDRWSVFNGYLCYRHAEDDTLMVEAAT
jgi:hypothetical protein